MKQQQKQNTAKRQLEIVINGEKYHYIETMGAMLDFKQETGKDMPDGLEETLKYMYHVVKSVCRRENKPFELSFDDFADGLDADEFNRVFLGLAGPAPEEGKEGGKKNA